MGDHPPLASAAPLPLQRRFLPVTGPDWSRWVSADQPSGRSYLLMTMNNAAVTVRVRVCDTCFQFLKVALRGEMTAGGWGVGG